MTDSTGTVVWAADYKPFGETTVTVSTITNNLRFPGQYFDAETGQNYNYSRDYNPVIGKYIEADRIGLSGGINLYAYVGLNPIGRTDRKGLDYWIEGPSPGEPAGHLSLSVGNPYGVYTSYSFGVNGQGFFEGEVYIDVKPGGKILPASYRRTTPEQDEMINQYLSSLKGTTAPYRPWRTCRSFSFEQFSILEDSSLAGKPIEPPVRSVLRGSPKTHPAFPLSTAATERW
jgi:RHS repeat-associated protein